MAKFSFFLCAFLVVSATAIPSPVNLQEGLLDLVKKLVKLVEDFLDKLIEEVKTLIQNVDADWEGFRQKAVDLTRKVLLDGLRRLKPILDQIAASSGDNGKKAAKCIEDNDELIIKVPVDVFDNFTKCAGPQLVKVIKQLGPLLNDLAEVQVDAKNAADEINACQGDDVQGLLCAAQALIDVLQVAATIPEKVKGDLAPVWDDIKVLIETARTCHETIKPNFFSEAGDVLEQVAKCIAS